MENLAKIGKSKYEELCKEACNNFVPSGNREKDEEQLLLAVCRNVFSYLDESLEFIPAGDSALYTYKYNLQRLVLTRQADSFFFSEPERIGQLFVEVVARPNLSFSQT